MLPLPTKFFVTSGKAVSKVSDLNAFDEALQNAGLAEQNIVSVSSVLPVGIKPVRRRDLPMGAITHCVLAQQRGGEGETVSAGIAYGFRDDGFGGYVAEGHMHGTKNSLREVMEWKMGEMAKLRGIKFRRIDYRIEELSIPMDHFGGRLAALVFLAGPSTAWSAARGANERRAVTRNRRRPPAFAASRSAWARRAAAPGRTPRGSSRLSAAKSARRS